MSNNHVPGGTQHFQRPASLLPRPYHHDSYRILLAAENTCTASFQRKLKRSNIIITVCRNLAVGESLGLVGETVCYEALSFLARSQSLQVSCKELETFPQANPMLRDPLDLCLFLKTVV